MGFRVSILALILSFSAACANVPRRAPASTATAAPLETRVSAWTEIERVHCVSYATDPTGSTAADARPADDCRDLYFLEHAFRLSFDGKAFSEPLPVEVLFLPEGGKLSRDVLSRFSTLQLGQAIVAHVQLRRDPVAGAGKPYFDFHANTSITLVFGDEDLDSIRTKGFLNSAQTKNGDNMDTAFGDVRGVSESIAGIDFSRLRKRDPGAFELFPKYAYLNIDSDPDSILWKTRIDRRYGNMIAVFDDSVKLQTTFTPGNSYVGGRAAKSLRVQAQTPFREPRYEGSFYGVGQGRAWGHHWEAQVWGALPWSKVKMLLVNCPGLRSSKPDVLQHALKDLRIPVHQCKMDDDRSRFIPGPRLN